MKSRCPFCKQLSLVSASSYHIQCTNCRAVLKTTQGRSREHKYTALAALLGVMLLPVAIYIYTSGDEPPVIDKRPADGEAENTKVTPGDGIYGNILSGYISSEDKWEADRQKVIESLKNEYYLDNFVCEVERPFLIVMEPSLDLIKDSSRLGMYKKSIRNTCDRFLAEFKRSLGLPDIVKVLPVVFFFNRESYDTYCRINGRNVFSSVTPSFYEYSNKRIICYISEKEQITRLNHEVVHQLVDYYTGILKTVTIPDRTFWLQEGLSCYFESFDVSDGKPCINWSRLIDSKDSIFNQKQYQSLQGLLALTLSDFWEWFNTRVRSGSDVSEASKVYYAVSWSFVYFLNHYNSSVYRSVLLKYMKSELEGTASKSLLEKLFDEGHSKTLNDIEKEFKQFVTTLN